MFTPIFVVGVPVHEQQGQPSQILMSWSLQDLTNYICQSYPVVSLNLVGFHMAKVNRCRRLVQEESLDPEVWINAGTPEVFYRVRPDTVVSPLCDNFMVDMDSSDDEVVEVIPAIVSEKIQLETILLRYQSEHLTTDEDYLVIVRRRNLLKGAVKSR
ncbi:hypothetical protein SKAU_G00280270 [Synaphobranchus kaupii]|uniref:Uncharacterized protein n=1 Tax=Synaphobranchus kaupii TaxID=118154 RepID=A0A9Q1EWY6_SYNKA|nr:hypothetical protein SKAU_G00280270 [Synaphobranchus kaupii]